MFGKEKDPAKLAHGDAVDQSPTEIAGDNSYHPGNGHVEYDELHVICPPHTTERRIVTRIDFRLMPFVTLLYLLAYLDRINIANAKVFSLVDDLALDGVKYNTALTMFFIPYVFFEIPSNIMLKKFSPKIWLPGCMLGFGIVSICQGLVQNYAGLLVTRFFLGLFETGMLPGCFYLLGMWYKRSEAQKRYSLFFSSTSLAGAFGGLLASAIGKMDGMRGFHGWRWIFILEGCLTIVIAVIFFFTFPSFPEQAAWLNEDERAYVKTRLQADQGRNAAERHVGFRDVLSVMKDPRVWLGGLMYFGLIIPAYGYAFFAPTIIQTYHYSAIQTQLHSVPPWAVAFGFSFLIAAISDWAKHRFLFTIMPLFLSIAGFSILLHEHSDINLMYGALFLVVMGTYGAMPIIICWFNMNLGGHHRRSIGTAWQIGFGNIGGIISTYAFISTDAPHFTKGYSLCLAFTSLSGLASIAYFVSNIIENKRRAKSVTNVGLSEYEKTELGDLNPEYRYMY
ncbi:major facilitator superfamily domain-containing protein [Pseudomassariella vexata]|uniref:Major facilitator superfamily domain-containing protein n=1 Tax=Pseudomassariella vexata TaxID=1141098 RepID=A0A1Y2EEJ5_9PEZI|nr:major facilitator superfamily domain-containing protein [Pseudomassariella vexata]ORY69992.1 major facilitator superfamily domain-containing protein [Pseudomassariella vexata]